MTSDVKAAVERLRILAEDETPPDGCRVLTRGDIRVVLDHLEAVERELGHAQYVAALKVQEVAKERDALRKRVEAAERVVHAAVALRNTPSKTAQERFDREIEVTELAREYDARFGGRADDK